jgi:hypothetical protein
VPIIQCQRHETAAGASPFEQHADGGLATRVAHLDEVLADQLGLARVHQVHAVHRVEEEVAVGAIVEVGELLHHLLLDLVVVAARVVERADGAERERHVVPQLGLLHAQVGGAHL